jgi:DNA-binding Xre family transcriptional regulator
MINNENKQTKIKQVLERKNISQSELFDRIKNNCNTHLGKDVISKIVNGKKTNYEIFTLLKLCVALDVTPNEIIEKDDFISSQLKK